MLLAVLLLGACATPQPRTDDPWEGFNRKSFAFNQKVDKTLVRPAAEGYRHVTTKGVRKHISTFFTNIRLPITVANDLLQARPKRAVQTAGRFIINMGIGFLGFFDPASDLGIPEDENDFGVTLARWGVPSGPFLTVPLLGPSSPRDVWRTPVDGYFFNPMGIYVRHHSHPYGQEYLPELVYLVSLRSSFMNAEDFLKSAYDPYVFTRDAYRQRRMYTIYNGNPPPEVMRKLQGMGNTPSDFDPEQLMHEQEQWRESHGDGEDSGNSPASGEPASASSSR